jgi:sarcosine oxidase, subunit beta
VNEFAERRIELTWAEPRRGYDVVIIGGGGHGLATAYYLATRHGITDVAVVESGYIGSGNSGRNTTVIRANYGVAESVTFYQHSLELYQRLERETERSLMHETRGLLWLAHSEATRRAERARATINTACGASTRFVEPDEVLELCPQIDLTGGGRYPVRGGSYHEQAATARHDRVVWALAEGAMRAGIHVLPHTRVTDIDVVDGRVRGVQTSAGPISARTVVSAVAGRSSTVAAMAGVRLPIRTHPLQAFVTSHHERCFDPIVASADLGFYLSQTPRGEMLIGGAIDRQPSYSQLASFGYLQTTALRAITLFPFLRGMRVLRQWAGICDMTPDASPIMGTTPVGGFLITAGWGTWGFKAIPAGGELMASLIATGEVPEMIAPFGLDRFARDRVVADLGSAGTH